MSKEYTQARKEANKRWDDENYKKFTVGADKKFIAEFDEIVSACGLSRNAAVKEAIQMWMDEHKTI